LPWVRCSRGPILGLGLLALASATGADAPNAQNAWIEPWPADAAEADLRQAVLVTLAVLFALWALRRGIQRISQGRDPDRGGPAALVRGVRFVFLSVAGLSAAAGWLLGHPLPLIVAIVIGAVDVIETTFLLLVLGAAARAAPTGRTQGALRPVPTPVSPAGHPSPDQGRAGESVRTGTPPIPSRAASLCEGGGSSPVEASSALSAAASTLAGGPSRPRGRPASPRCARSGARRTHVVGDRDDRVAGGNPGVDQGPDAGNPGPSCPVVGSSRTRTAVHREHAGKGH
jgi:hypothetical protein